MREGITALIAAHPARLRNGLLGQALASVLAQTLQPAAIYVVNDVERLGAGNTRQELLKAVDTQWIAWLDSDDTWDPDHLEKLHRCAVETDSKWVYSWFRAPSDPLGHFGKPFNPCQPHHTTMVVLEDTAIAQEVGFPETQKDWPVSNEDLAHIFGFAKICCERGFKMTHLAERTWNWRQSGQNSSGRPEKGDAVL